MWNEITSTQVEKTCTVWTLKNQQINWMYCQERGGYRHASFLADEHSLSKPAVCYQQNALVALWEGRRCVSYTIKQVLKDIFATSDAAQLYVNLTTFRTNVLPLSSGWAGGSIFFQLFVYLYQTALRHIFLTNAAITSNSVTAFILAVFGEDVLVYFVN
jgi:hypothetical protein